MFVSRKKLQAIDDDIGMLAKQIRELKDELKISTNIRNTAMPVLRSNPWLYWISIPITDAISIILEHLGLEIAKVPEPDQKFRLIEKEKE